MDKSQRNSHKRQNSELLVKLLTDSTTNIYNNKYYDGTTPNIKLTNIILQYRTGFESATSEEMF